MKLESKFVCSGFTTYLLPNMKTKNHNVDN